MPELITLHAISGEYDMIALVEAEHVAALNEVIDKIDALDGARNLLDPAGDRILRSAV